MHPVLALALDMFDNRIVEVRFSWCYVDPVVSEDPLHSSCE